MKRSGIIPIGVLAIIVAACTGATSESPAATGPGTPAPTEASATMAPASEAPSVTAKPGDIVATADAAGSFKTLLAAATAAGLVETLQGDGPFTIFAPTDEAFAALPAGTLDSLLADTAALKQILLYHVVSGAVKAADVVGMTSAESLEGSPITVAVKDGTVYLNETAKVIATDVVASNGVIHVIDQVLLPPSE
ncbi:MAG TPA: fasciclin domain-containing protein [Candidatus Limnocylindrales bacterium]|jgi:uncharacterized surface protein with fasciclin (FAS1) repeats